MSEIIQKAITHIDEQAEKAKDALSKTIAQYIIDHCLSSDKNAQLALDSDKSLKKCATQVNANARKLATGGCAVVEDSVVWRWVREYFGFEELQSNAQTAANTQTAASGPISLLDYM